MDDRNGDPMQEVCIPHSIPRAWEEEETNMNNARVVRNLEERNVGMKEKSHK